jgi:hypothetical protein
LGSQSKQRIIEGRPRVVAALAKHFGSLDIADEAQPRRLRPPCHR